MSGEIWRDIPGFQFYQASSAGRIRSVDRIAPGGWRGDSLVRGRVLAQRKLNSGYFRVCLSEGGHTAYRLVHVLVALAFHGEPPGSHGKRDKGDNYHVDHMNEIRTDNRAVNLRWLRQWKNVGAKLTPSQIKEIRRLHATGRYLQRELGEQFGVTRECIGRIVRGENWKHVS